MVETCAPITRRDTPYALEANRAWGGIGLIVAATCFPALQREVVTLGKRLVGAGHGQDSATTDSPETRKKAPGYIIHDSLENIEKERRFEENMDWHVDWGLEILQHPHRRSQSLQHLGLRFVAYYDRDRDGSLCGPVPLTAIHTSKKIT